MAKMKGRLFIAAPLTEDLREQLDTHLDRALDGGRLPGRPVPPENWHLTLRFLGDTTREAYDALLPLLRAEPFGEPFELSFTSLGAFPKPQRARVLWLGTGAGAGTLAVVAARVEATSVEAGFEPERRRFKAHLTLCRLKPEGDVRDLIDRVPPFDRRMPVENVVVYRSHLGPGGARYEVLERLPLRLAPTSETG